MEVAEIIKTIERTSNRYLTPDQARDYMGGISKSTLWKWVNHDGLPQIKKSGDCPIRQKRLRRVFGGI